MPPEQKINAGCNLARPGSFYAVNNRQGSDQDEQGSSRGTGLDSVGGGDWRLRFLSV